MAGHDLIGITRPALLDGTISLVISHPLDRLAKDTLRGMLASISDLSNVGRFTGIVPFEIRVPENL